MTKQKQGGSNSNSEGRLKRWILLNETCGPGPSVSKKDVVAWHVCEIAEYFKVPEGPYDSKIEMVPPAHFVDWLDELQGYAEFMELAHELHSIDRLFPLLHNVLVYPHAGIRAKTAELVTTMVHNNPTSQQLVRKLNGIKPLWSNFAYDPDVTVRTKTLGAISALLWNNKPGITKFYVANGYAYLYYASSKDSVGLQREALNLTQYLLHEDHSCNRITVFGFPPFMIHLASSDDAEVRVAALRGLLVLTRNEAGNNGQLVKNNDKLKQVLQELIKGISAMAPEDIGAAREEIHLVDSLWNACYNEPSSLKLFEPSLREL